MVRNLGYMANVLRTPLPLPRAAADGLVDETTPPGAGLGATLGAARRLARHQLAVPGAVGFLGAFLASMAATHPGGVFLIRSDPWFFRIPPFSGASQNPSLAAFYIGVFMLVGAWIAVVRATRSPDGPTTGPVLVVMALWALPFIVGPPMFSGDVFVYASDGQLVNHGLNPYATTPYALGPSPFRSASHGIWLHTVSPYGPLFLRLAGVASTIGAHTVVGTVIVFRLLACAGLSLAAVSLTSIARRHGQRPAHVLALALLSPLTLLHLVSAGHNDAIMVGLLAAGVALACSGRPLSGIVLCTVAAAVKLPAAAAIVFIVWGLVRDAPSMRSRAAAVARGGAVALGTIAAATAASGLSWGWLGALGVPGTASPRLAVVNDLAFGFDHYLHLSFPTALHLWRDIGMVLALATVAYLLLRSARDRWVTALGAALVVVAVLGPTFYPWYLTWGLMLVAATAADRWERAIIWASVVPTFAVAPGGEGWLDQASKVAGTWVARSVVGAVVAVAVVTIRRPGWIASFFRADPVRPVSPDRNGERADARALQSAPLAATAHRTDGDGHLAPAPPSEEVMS
jgi:alpha-1,6-mannosyltransferase